MNTESSNIFSDEDMPCKSSVSPTEGGISHILRYSLQSIGMSASEDEEVPNVQRFSTKLAQNEAQVF